MHLVPAVLLEEPGNPGAPPAVADDAQLNLPVELGGRGGRLRGEAAPRPQGNGGGGQRAAQESAARERGQVSGIRRIGRIGPVRLIFHNSQLIPQSG